MTVNSTNLNSVYNDSISSLEGACGSEEVDFQTQMQTVRTSFNEFLSQSKVIKQGLSEDLRKDMNDLKAQLDQIKTQNDAKDATHKYAWNAEPILDSGWHISQTIIWVKTHFTLSLGQLYHRTYEPCFVGWKKGRAQKRFSHPKLTNLSDVFNLDFDEFTDLFDLWYEKRDNTNSYVHPTQKPIKLAERALKRSTRRGELVLDLFGGSGSTMIACDQMGRVNHSMELDPKFCDVIVRRYINWCQQKGKEIEVTKNGEPIEPSDYGIEI